MTEPSKQKPRVFTLAKTFSDIEHAKAFLRGDVLMRTIRYFRGVEDTANALRGDTYEGAAGIIQPATISKITIAGRDFKPSLLAGPIRYHRTDVLSWHVLCMHAVGLLPGDPETFYSTEDAKASIQLRPECTRFGPHAVYLLDLDTFAERLESAISELGHDSRRDLVSYFDEVAFSGRFDESDVPFKKPKRFSFQREYRFVAETQDVQADPFILKIGSIADIAKFTTVDDFNNSLDVSFNARQP